jgi:hypothetical protein
MILQDRKIENNMAPTYLSDCLPTTIGETVTYNLRNNDDYRTQRCRLQTSSKSFFQRGSFFKFTLYKSALRPLHLCLSLVYIMLVFLSPIL